VSGLDQIEVAVESPESPEMVRSILAEIGSRIEHYLHDGTRGEIDLQGLPLSAADRQHLQQMLGVGEVTITIDVMGRSEIRETSFPGVWWVTHRDGEERAVAQLIEIDEIPRMVAADRPEMEQSAARLKGNNQQKR